MFNFEKNGDPVGYEFFTTRGWKVIKKYNNDKNNLPQK